MRGGIACRGKEGRVSFCDSQFVVIENENNSWITLSTFLDNSVYYGRVNKLKLPSADIS